MERSKWVIRLYAGGAVAILAAVGLVFWHASMPMEYRSALGFVMGGFGASLASLGAVAIAFGREVAKGEWPP